MRLEWVKKERKGISLPNLEGLELAFPKYYNFITF